MRRGTPVADAITTAPFSGVFGSNRSAAIE
jgi:hypothetical protein